MLKYHDKQGTVVQDTKSTIRKKLFELLRKQKEEERVIKSRVIQKRLFAMPEFQRAQHILFYASFDGEVETTYMMQEAQKLGKKIVLPIILKDQRQIIPSLVENLSQEEFKEGPYGVKQPLKECRLDLTKIDLVIVPGVAFDKCNHRLGRGAGYYDRFLKTISPETPTVGLAFDFQILDRLPHQEHDIPVSFVLTN